MLMENFQISRPVGTGHSRPNDVIRLRKALRETGHGSSPPDPSGVYDSSLHGTIKRFQIDYGLPPDGIVTPDGPTARMLDAVVTSKRQAGDEGPAQLREVVNAAAKEGLKPQSPPSGDPRPIVFADANGDIASSDQILNIVRRSSDRPVGRRPGEVQVAFAPAIAAGVIGEAAWNTIAALLGIGIGVAGAAKVSEAIKNKAPANQNPTPEQRNPSDANGARRTVDTPSDAAIYPGNHEPPNLPNRTEFPAEPPDRSKNNGTEAFPAQPSQPEILKGSKIQEARPGIFVFPDLSGAFNDWMILERRRGNEKTRSGLEKVRDFVVENLLYGDPKDWEHIGGGRKKGTRQEIPEFWIPGPQKDFEQKGETIDGRKGGKFVDLTFKNKKTGEMVHVQTVDTDKNGKPTERELNNAEIIKKRTGARVYLFGKDAIPE